MNDLKSQSIRGLIGGLVLAMSIGFNSGPSLAQDSKLIIGAVGFPCGLNDFAKIQCAGFEAGKEGLPEGYAFELKTGIDFADNVAFNNLIETSMELNPAGFIIFPGGSTAQVPLLKRACERGIKVIIIDIPVEGLGECQTSYIRADNHGLGAKLGEWLIAHPPKTKEVGIVTLQPGLYGSNDARIEGFTKTIEAAGYTVVATVVTDLSLDKTRTLVTNMLTAHPNIGTVFSANDQMGYGAAQAIEDPEIVQLSVDAALDAVQRIVDGKHHADAAQDPFSVAKTSIETMVKALEGETVAPDILTEGMVVDASNAAEFLQAGGMQGMAQR